MQSQITHLVILSQHKKNYRENFNIWKIFIYMLLYFHQKIPFQKNISLSSDFCATASEGVAKKLIKIINKKIEYNRKKLNYWVHFPSLPPHLKHQRCKNVSIWLSYYDLRAFLILNSYMQLFLLLFHRRLFFQFIEWFWINFKYILQRREKVCRYLMTRIR